MAPPTDPPRVSGSCGDVEQPAAEIEGAKNAALAKAKPTRRRSPGRAPRRAGCDELGKTSPRGSNVENPVPTGSFGVLGPQLAPLRSRVEAIVGSADGDADFASVITMVTHFVAKRHRMAPDLGSPHAEQTGLAVLRSVRDAMTLVITKGELVRAREIQEMFARLDAELLAQTARDSNVVE
jgi:hypothetical protein